MEKVLVTGAYGFLGKYGIRELLDNGYGVISFGRKKQELNKLRQENVEICIGDLRVRNDVVNAEKMQITLSMQALYLPSGVKEKTL